MKNEGWEELEKGESGIITFAKTGLGWGKRWTLGFEKEAHGYGLNTQHKSNRGEFSSFPWHR